MEQNQIFISPLEGLSLLSPCSPNIPTYVSTPIQVVSYPDEKRRKRRRRNANKEEETSEDSSDDEREPKPRINPEKWAVNIRKTNANLGLAYTNKRGKLVKEKTIGPPCECHMKCYQRLGQDECDKIFSNFWKIGDHNLQNAYIAGCARISLPRYKGKDPSTVERNPRKMFVRKYYVNAKGVDTEVCKNAFLNLHSISNGRLQRQCMKKQQQGNAGVDARGRHHNKVNKIPEEKINEVRLHIDGYRNRAGLSGPRKSARVQVLPAPLSISVMYKAYHKEQTLAGKTPLCEFRYRKILQTDFNIDFVRSASLPTPKPSKQPRVPTVETIDILSKVDIIVDKAANPTQKEPVDSEDTSESRGEGTKPTATATSAGFFVLGSSVPVTGMQHSVIIDIADDGDGSNMSFGTAKISAAPFNTVDTNTCVTVRPDFSFASTNANLVLFQSPNYNHFQF